MTQPIILVKTWYKTVVFHSSSLKHLDGDFLASADIKAFGLTKIQLLFIGLAFFYAQSVFV